MGTDAGYYMCPFCVSSWVCHGPHVEPEDLPKYVEKLRYMQQDLAEFSKEVVLKYGDGLSTEELAKLVEQKLLTRHSV
jgi:hypothetical protein